MKMDWGKKRDRNAEVRPGEGLRPIPPKIADHLDLSEVDRRRFLVDDKRQIWNYPSEAAAKKALEKRALEDQQKEDRKLKNKLRGAGAAVGSKVVEGIVGAGVGLRDGAYATGRWIRDNPGHFIGLGLAAYANLEICYNLPLGIGMGVVSAGLIASQEIYNRRKRRRD